MRPSCAMGCHEAGAPRRRGRVRTHAGSACRRCAGARDVRTRIPARRTHRSGPVRARHARRTRRSRRRCPARRAPPRAACRALHDACMHRCGARGRAGRRTVARAAQCPCRSDVLHRAGNTRPRCDRGARSRRARTRHFDSPGGARIPHRRCDRPRALRPGHSRVPPCLRHHRGPSRGSGRRHARNGPHRRRLQRGSVAIAPSRHARMARRWSAAQPHDRGDGGARCRVDAGAGRVRRLPYPRHVVRHDRLARCAHAVG